MTLKTVICIIFWRNTSDKKTPFNFDHNSKLMIFFVDRLSILTYYFHLRDVWKWKKGWAKSLCIIGLKKHLLRNQCVIKHTIHKSCTLTWVFLSLWNLVKYCQQDVKLAFDMLADRVLKLSKKMENEVFVGQQ